MLEQQGFSLSDSQDGVFGVFSEKGVLIVSTNYAFIKTRVCVCVHECGCCSYLCTSDFKL